MQVRESAATRVKETKADLFSPKDPHIQLLRCVKVHQVATILEHLLNSWMASADKTFLLNGHVLSVRLPSHRLVPTTFKLKWLYSLSRIYYL